MSQNCVKSNFFSILPAILNLWSWHTAHVSYMPLSTVQGFLKHALPKFKLKRSGSCSLYSGNIQSLSTCYSLCCLQCLLDSLLLFGAVGLSSFLSICWASAAQSHLVDFKKDNKKWLLVDGPTPRQQPSSSGVPLLAYAEERGKDPLKLSKKNKLKSISRI